MKAPVKKTIFSIQINIYNFLLPQHKSPLISDTSGAV